MERKRIAPERRERLNTEFAEAHRGHREEEEKDNTETLRCAEICRGERERKRRRERKKREEKRREEPIWRSAFPGRVGGGEGKRRGRVRQECGKRAASSRP
jgi:hypothetical protein